MLALICVSIINQLVVRILSATFRCNCLVFQESIDGVCDTKFDERNACDASVLLHWEQLHSVQFPVDVKNFYLSTNGLDFTWKFRLCGTLASLINSSNDTRCDVFIFFIFQLGNSFPVGRMHVSSLSELCPVTDCWKSDSKNSIDRDLSRLFTLDANMSQGIYWLSLNICIVIVNKYPIW